MKKTNKITQLFLDLDQRTKSGPSTLGKGPPKSRTSSDDLSKNFIQRNTPFSEINSQNITWTHKFTLNPDPLFDTEICYDVKKLCKHFYKTIDNNLQLFRNFVFVLEYGNSKPHFHGLIDTTHEHVKTLNNILLNIYNVRKKHSKSTLQIQQIKDHPNQVPIDVQWAGQFLHGPLLHKYYGDCEDPDTGLLPNNIDWFESTKTHEIKNNSLPYLRKEKHNKETCLFNLTTDNKYLPCIKKIVKKYDNSQIINTIENELNLNPIMYNSS